MKKGNFAEACPKLEASEKREPRSGTLLNLASCREQEGKTATAWALYKEAAALARSEKRQQNVTKATTLGMAIEARLTRLRVEVSAMASEEAIMVDGAALDAGGLGLAVPVDPGKHVVSASAPGYQSWSADVVVEHDVTVTVPALPKVDEPVAAGPASEPQNAPISAAEPNGSRRVPAWAWIAGGVGVALVATSVVFKVDQSVAASNLDDKCGPERRFCGDSAGYDFESDRSREKRDFALFAGLGAGGIVGLGVAAYGFLTAQRGTSAEHPRARSFVTPVFTAGPSSAHAGLRGAF